MIEAFKYGGEMSYPITHYEYMMCDKITNMLHIIEKIKEKVGDENMDFLEFSQKILASKKMKKMFIMSGLLHADASSDTGAVMGQANMALRMCYHIWRMNCVGEKIYHLPPGICTLLQNTKLTIDAEFIEAPFEEIYLYTDQTAITMTDYTGTLPMKGIYVNVNVESDGVKKVRFLATSGADGVDENLDINHFACFYIPEHGNLDEICNDQMKMFAENSNSNFMNVKVDMITIENIFRFIVNALIYIGCRNAELCPITPPTLDELIGKKKSNKKVRKLTKKFERSARKPFIYVTHDKPLPKYDTGSGKKLDHEVLVGGYWRGQWYGPRDNQEKKVIRIDSYTKGVGLGKRKKKKYIVKS